MMKDNQNWGGERPEKTYTLESLGNEVCQTQLIDDDPFSSLNEVGILPKRIEKIELGILLIPGTGKS